jgi:hypothetical protein
MKITRLNTDQSEGRGRTDAKGRIVAKGYKLIVIGGTAAGLLNQLPVHHKKIVIIFQFEVSLLIIEMIDGPFLRLINTGEMVEIKSLFEQPFFGDLGFPVGIHFCKYAPVLAQYAVDISHQVICVAFKLVVISVTTHIGTEFLICSSAEFFTALEALSFFGHHFIV